MKFVIYTGLIFFVCFRGGEATYKRWLKDTNFENPLNWNVQPPRAPCGNDRVIIPNDSPVVYLQMNTSLQELTLPKTGEVILGNGVRLTFTQDPSDDCPSAGGDVEFAAVNPSSWFNPDNWCSTNTELADCQPSSPVDSENVPCLKDDVVFLRHRSYFVTLSHDLQLTMKTLKITGTSFTTSSFRQFVTSADGRKIFKTPSSGTETPVTITRQGCSDIGGCACGNDQGQMLKTICDIKSKTCERSPCNGPVTPVGACCDMCGAVFNCTRGRGFNFNSFKSKLQNTFFKLYPNVTTAVSVTGAGFVQIVLKDQQGGDGSDSTKLAALIKADMDDDLKKGGHKYALDAVALTAESTGGKSAHKGSSAALEGGSIAGIIIGVIFLVVIVAVVVLVYRRGRPDLSRLPNWPDWSNFSSRWSRFSGDRREPPSGSATPPRILGPLDPGFDNPLYDSAPFDDSNAREMELRSPMDEQPTFEITGKDGAGFNNPLYASTPGFFTDATETGAKPQPPPVSSHF